MVTTCNWQKTSPGGPFSNRKRSWRFMQCSIFHIMWKHRALYKDTSSAHSWLQSQTDTHTLVHTHICMHSHMHINMYARIHVCIHACVHMHMCTNMHAIMQTHTHMQTHTYIQTHTHTLVRGMTGIMVCAHCWGFTESYSCCSQPTWSDQVHWFRMPKLTLCHSSVRMGLA